MGRLGLRRTVSRMLILGILAEKDTHLSVLRLHQMVTASHPMVNLSTVYRNVAAMTEHGVLHSVEHTGQALFGLAATPHHHLICERCGRLDEVPADELSQAAALLLTAHGFEIEPAGQLLRGRCRRCRHAANGAR
ncbi:Fur family transcriptional regulator [Nonomuraea rhizosphaerae]|uniref:Fur family transcriptional regulator n=1 Tax=Nonomuraea rhizosphaerae TaxID=2665663 RepID=UPI002484BD84|nr:transcriptional repressor [Nonomuraea rhizosphaerae]